MKGVGGGGEVARTGGHARASLLCFSYEEKHHQVASRRACSLDLLSWPRPRRTSRFQPQQRRLSTPAAGVGGCRRTSPGCRRTSPGCRHVGDRALRTTPRGRRGPTATASRIARRASTPRGPPPQRSYVGSATAAAPTQARSPQSAAPEGKTETARPRAAHTALGRAGHRGTDTPRRAARAVPAAPVRAAMERRAGAHQLSAAGVTNIASRSRSSGL